MVQQYFTTFNVFDFKKPSKMYIKLNGPYEGQCNAEIPNFRFSVQHSFPHSQLSLWRIHSHREPKLGGISPDLFTRYNPVTVYPVNFQTFLKRQSFVNKHSE